MSTPNRWAIRDAGEATFYSLVDGRAIVTLTTLKTSGVETTGETVYARGGRGNAKIVGFSSDRESRLVLQDAIFDNEAVAMLTGNDLIAGKRTVDFHEIITVASNAAALSKTPKEALVSVYQVEADGTNGVEYTLGNPTDKELEYSIADKEITFHSSVSNNTKIRVYYKAETSLDAKTIKVTSDKFGGSFKVVLDVLVVDEFTKKAFQGQLVIPNGKFEDNFDLSFEASGEPDVLDLNLEILKSPVNADMWELIIFDEEEIV